MALNTTFTAGNILTAAQMNNLPWGIAGVSQLYTQFSTSATHTVPQDTGLTTTFTAVAGRRYRITLQGNYYPNGGVQGMKTNILWGANVVGAYTFPSPGLSTSQALSVSNVLYYVPASSGSVTVKSQLSASTNNTQVSDFADGSQAISRSLIVEDIGQA